MAPHMPLDRGEPLEPRTMVSAALVPQLPS